MADRDFDFPWFPLYHEKFTNSPDVRMMSPEEVGVYILLLCHQWDKGTITRPTEELARLCNGADANTVSTVLERCFNAVDGGWQNERLAEIRDEQTEKRMAKVRAGKASARARKEKKEQRSNTVATETQQTVSNKEEDVEEELEGEGAVFLPNGRNTERDALGSYPQKRAG